MLWFFFGERNHLPFRFNLNLTTLPSSLLVLSIAISISRSVFDFDSALHQNLSFRCFCNLISSYVLIDGIDLSVNLSSDFRFPFGRMCNFLGFVFDLLERELLLLLF